MRPAPSQSTLPLLLEIGCEEIPARFLKEAETNFADGLEIALGKERLLPDKYAPPQHYSTPRRLVAWFPAILQKAEDKIEKVLGPPLEVAFDKDNKPTRAGEGFASKFALSVDKLVTVKTPKGERLAVELVSAGRAAHQILPELIPAVVKDTGLRFAKSMYWVGKSGPQFVRPIRWVLALLGEGKGARVMPFEIAGVRSGNLTCGHRTYGKRPIRIESFKQYSKKLREAYVEFDPENRRQRIRERSKALLETFLRIVEDKELEDWTVNSTEWPSAIRGGFHERFLHLPREILITVMRDHQKYFAVEDRKGNLQPHFVAVLNMGADAKGLIRQGHERVLTARFSDAEFFWTADQRLRLEQRAEMLARVTFQAELGSYAEKVRRMKAIANHLCEALEAHPDSCIPGDSILPDNARATKGASTRLVRFVPMVGQRVMRAIELCKCDLTTQMVQEFPELQGVVGGLYATAQGESSQIADAVYDHYLPQGAEDRCPRSIIGAVVSLADKLDNVVGGFAVGHEPSGSSDPFALRRQGNAIVKVLLEFRLPLSLRQAAEQALNALDVQWRKPQLDVFQQVMEFFEERLRYYLETLRSFRYDTVRAVLAAGWDVPADALARAGGLEAIRGSENFEALSVAAKRIKNILSKSATAADWEPGEVDTGALKESAEEGLYRAYRKVAEDAGSLGKAGEYRRALESISGLRPVVDRFFDKVLVMAEDPAIRRNRLRLLGKLDELFSGIAQFAEIAAGPANVDASTLKGSGT